VKNVVFCSGYNADILLKVALNTHNLNTIHIKF